MLRACAVGVVCVAVGSGCSTIVSGAARPQRARDAGAPVVAADGVDRLLLSENQIGEIVGGGARAAEGFVISRRYSVITQPQGESFSDPSCASSLYNTMYTSYAGSGYTAVAGRTLHEPGPHPTHDIDEAVVAFPSADVATRFVVRTSMAWQRCADVHLSTTEPPPDPVTLFYTLGFPSATGDVATVVNVLEGGQGKVCAHAIASRANVVIDVYIFGPKVTAAQPVAIVTAIAENMPH